MMEVNFFANSIARQRPFQGSPGSRAMNTFQTRSNAVSKRFVDQREGDQRNWERRKRGLGREHGADRKSKQGSEIEARRG
jgi:hypothetical protein